MPKASPVKAARKEDKNFEREVAIGSAKYRVKNVFTGQASLGDALKNIIAKMLVIFCLLSAATRV